MQKKDSLENDQKLTRVHKSKLVSYINIKTIVAFLAGVILTLLIFLGVKALTVVKQNQENAIDYETILDLSEYIGEGNLDASWNIAPADPSISNIMLESGHGFEGRSAILHFYKTGANDFTLTSSSGEVFTFTISIDDKENISIIRR